ncbi:MAG TPA: DUF1028 domain-containing protein [Phycisphaerae bacterium]|nr:DUF1028 domain-containing protein [Phycisphaerae bacterium]
MRFRSGLLTAALVLDFPALLVGASLPAGAAEVAESPPLRPVHTYSIVARDPQTGQLGVAVQSHWFSVGTVVPWAEAGVGAVATQSFADPSYGPAGLDLMRMGKSAPDALRGLLAADTNREVRQVAMIDAAGRVAAFTGARCIAAAGQVVDADAQFSVQANLMASDAVWPAMAAAYRSAKGDLADRMLAALAAAEQAGGDIRGRQSAALIVVGSKNTGQPWKDRVFDLRVDDHADPVAEISRLVRVARAYQHMNAGDAALEHDDFDAANREYTEAARLAPQTVEIPFWQAVTLVSAGRVTWRCRCFTTCSNASRAGRRSCRDSCPPACSRTIPTCSSAFANRGRHRPDRPQRHRPRGRAASRSCTP